MPALETARLRLREMTAQDAPALLAVVGDAETMRWYPRPLTLMDVDKAIARQIGRYPSGTGLLGLALREDGALIGDCGITWQEVDGVLEPEIGYHVRRDCWNRGYATEAAGAVRDYAFATLGCHHVISLIRPENLPSRRVAEKNGLSLNRMVFWHDYEHCVYRLEKEAAR
jgi:[ribosomal protein S5]-alanine N-acetyltransferase